MLKIAIVDDFTPDREKLAQCLLQYGKEADIKFDISYFKDGIEIVDRYIGFDIIYFDVEMEIMDGMTAAKKIRALDPKVTIVFLTNYVQWAIEGYSVQASDFLLKPLSYFSFKEHFKKLLQRIQPMDKATYSIKNAGNIQKILVDDIYYVESQGHYLHFHLRNQPTITLLNSLKNVEKELAAYDFFRCNNCYLVNLNHVEAIEGQQAIVAGEALQISRPRKKEFLQQLTLFMAKDGK
ncbi:LytR/AlgR family response regulator transcription factor [Enterococcus columbae]|uniref:Response regulatory domain-containing protein n=1 Tax=Enterococcus columbae DSM 7374 = ATCC 51263 TaxID=1121865 RepID=S1N3F1_9ENTE|nr:LytTR family DNA-binding domain-containing protein [Enterococcus columbae]EOT39616.1 hypothetical protein OMW_01916 [Enterococcus columbae DSM 7374 = ATCC 51263]EOW80143.1 hypothetical protein I568_02222 [Enterococcus columbae DSM 7374 = ATCC 51263]OJG21738.1 hypothetical protein RR47_GL001181 [Enterococcus columbae DSM 7374 = ATCC 51263]